MKKTSFGVGLGVLILLVAIVAWNGFGPKDQGKQGAGGEDQGSLSSGNAEADAKQFQLLRMALAETENLNSDAAEPLWQQLLQQDPANLDAWQNLAITQLSRIAELMDQAQFGDLDAAERGRIEEAIPVWIEKGRETIAKMRAVAQRDNDPTRTAIVLWMDARLGFLVAQQSQENQQQRMGELATAMAARLQGDPRSLILAGPLAEEIAELARDPFGGGDRELIGRIAAALTAAAEASPRNLFVNFAALKYAIEAEQAGASELAQRLEGLIAPFIPVLEDKLQGSGIDPRGFAVQITDDIRGSRWSEARIAGMQWLNVVKGLEIFKSDRRQALPHPLDLIATRSFNVLALSQASTTMPVSQAKPRFVPETVPAGLDQDIRAIASVDLDLLGGEEIAIATQEQVRILQRTPSGMWEEQAAAAAPAGTRGIHVADLFEVDISHPERIRSPQGDRAGVSGGDMGRLERQHDTFPCLVLWGEYGVRIYRIDGRSGIEKDQRLILVDRETGLESLRDCTACVSGDLDADGDLDLFLATENEGVQLWINRGNITFFSVTAASQLPAAGDAIVAMSIGDLDRDLDLDIVTIQRSGKVGWLENLLHLQMRWRPLDPIPAEGAGNGVAMLEWDGNVSWDVAYWHDSRLGIWTSETMTAGNIQPLGIDAIQTPAGVGQEPVFGNRLLSADLDNDSWTDLLMVGPGGVEMLQGGPKPIAELARHSLSSEPAAQVIRGDWDQDGAIDIGLLQGGGLVIWRNQTEVGHYLDFQMKGIDDNRSGRNNHYAIGSTVELRIGPHYRAAVIDQRTTHFGLGAATEADNLRIILTNGVTQNLIRPTIDAMLVEKQTLKGSCPYLYAWDGTQISFVTDCLWAAPLGLQMAAGKVVPDRPWEYLKVDGRLIAPRDGMYDLRLTEELWELAYFDHVSLIAVDHPRDVEIWTNEKVGPPGTVEPRIFTFTETRAVTSAVDTQGSDCLSLLQAADERYVQGFQRRILQGLCPPHWIELGLGPIADTDRVLLKLTGWIFPTDSSLNIQIDQHPELETVEPPSVWIPGPDTGSWTKSIASMGFPGGKTKTIVVDLTGHLNLEDPRVRIQTTAQIYWDAAEVVVNPPEVAIQSIPLEMVSAEVCFHGFSEALPRQSTQPHRYDYSRTSVESPWPPLGGRLTRWGDCLQLLTAWDDAMVVIAGGDEIRLRFRVPEQEVPPGWKRDFILHSVGWDKDADLNTLEGQTVEPLPFRQMHAYPPRWIDVERATEVENLNRSHRIREQSFRKFWTR